MNNTRTWNILLALMWFFTGLINIISGKISMMSYVCIWIVVVLLYIFKTIEEW